jgi:hypothetical protein
MEKRTLRDDRKLVVCLDFADDLQVIALDTLPAKSKDER